MDIRGIYDSHMDTMGLMPLDFDGELANMAGIVSDWLKNTCGHHVDHVSIDPDPYTLEEKLELIQEWVENEITFYADMIESYIFLKIDIDLFELGSDEWEPIPADEIGDGGVIWVERKKIKCSMEIEQ